MKNLRKPKQIVLLSVLSGILYLYLIGTYLLSEWDDFQLGFNSGWNETEDKNTNNNTYCPSNETFYFYAEAKKGFASFPDTITNHKSKQMINIRHSEFKASVSKSSLNSAPTFPYNLLSFLISSIMLVICIVIPVQFYSIIGSITKEVIFEKANIKQIRTIGISLILFYFLYFSYNYLNYLRNCELFEFKNYTLKMNSVDPIWLLLGIVVLLIAEIVSRGKTLKEEHDLTI